MNRTIKPLNQEGLIKKLLRTKNNWKNFGDQKYIYIMMLINMYLLISYMIILTNICTVI